MYKKKSCFKWALIFLLVSLVGLIIILSCVPPISRDALVYHLALPKLYLAHGGIYEIPSLAFSYFPVNLSLLYAIPLYFGNDIAPKFIHFSFALLTAWLIFVYLKKRLDTVYALFGSLFFLSLPLIVKLSITAYVDLGLVFFSTASLFYLLRWIETRFRLKYLIISGLWCGFALGTKYNGLITLFFFTMFVPFVYSKPAGAEPGSQYKAIGYGAVFMLTALLVFSPWMIRNYIWTQNPIYPLYDNWFNPENPAPQYSILTIMNFEMRTLIQKESWWEIALLPIRIFFQGKDGDPQYFDGKLNPFLLFLPLFAFWRFQSNAPDLKTEKKIFLAFSLLVLYFVLFTTNMCQLRYIAVILPPLVILAVFGLHEICTFCKGRYATRTSLYQFISPFRKGGRGDSAFEKRQLRQSPPAPLCERGEKLTMWCNSLGKVCTVITGAAIAVMLFLNGMYIAEQFKYVDPIPYITGRVTRDQYIERYRHEYPAIQFANKNFPETAKIFGIFLGERRYYSDREMLFDINWLLKTITEADSPEKLVHDFRTRNITHLLIRYDLFNQWCNNNFDDSKKGLITAFFKDHLTPVFSKNGYGVFELRIEN